MTTAWTYVDILDHLGDEEVLHAWLTEWGLDIKTRSPDRSGETVSQNLARQLEAVQNPELRERLIAGLQRSAQLAHPRGRDAMFEAAATRADVFMGLAACKSDLHRSFWLYSRHRGLFDHACAAEYLDANVARAQQHDLGVKVAPCRHAEAVEALCTEIGAFYRQRFSCGERCVAQLFERGPNVFVLTVHVKDLPTMRLEFEGDGMRQRVGHPSIHIVLEYAPRTGVARTFVRGGLKFHQMLVNAFADHLLGCKVDAKRVVQPMLDLSPLRAGFDVPRAIDDGFAALQVKSLSLSHPQGLLKLECSATAKAQRRCVSGLLRQHLQDANPLMQDWIIEAATIALYYPPKPGRSRMRSVCFDVTNKGRLSLHKFEAQLQTQLEGYLVDLGILDADQTLCSGEDEGFAHKPEVSQA